MKRRLLPLIPLLVLSLAGCANPPKAKDVAVEAHDTLVDVQNAIASVQRTGKPSLLIFAVEGYSLDGFSSAWSNQQGKLLYEGPIAGLPFEFDLASLELFGLSGTVTLEEGELGQRTLTTRASYTGNHQTVSRTEIGSRSTPLSCVISSKILNNTIRIVTVNR